MSVFDFRPFFRPMEEEDLPFVLLLEKEGHLVPWTEGIFRDCLRVGYVCTVMEEKRSIDAYAVMSVALGEAHVFNVCVRTTRRRQGIGRSLMQYLLDCAQAKGAKTVFLEVRPSNSGAVVLYEDMGFVEVGRRKDYYPAPHGREDALIMAKEILV